MPILSFKKYHDATSKLTESVETPVFAKTIELSHADMYIVIDIVLAHHEQHTDAINFLRQVADEIEFLSAMKCNRQISTTLS
ncbi:MAG: hypothetical protein ACK5GN_09670 [Pseudomonadota bacterium]|jgi:hypothetical protein